MEARFCCRRLAYDDLYDISGRVKGIDWLLGKVAAIGVL